VRIVSHSNVGVTTNGITVYGIAVGGISIRCKTVLVWAIIVCLVATVSRLAVGNFRGLFTCTQQRRRQHGHLLLALESRYSII
jgi:hypothetical protein